MLDKCRNQIDELDEQIIKLIDARFKVTSKVGKYKRAHHIEVLNSNREREIIEKIRSKELENTEQVAELYMCMMDISKRQQDE